jgi:outer membrane lipoprotein-sorting protein
MKRRLSAALLAAGLAAAAFAQSPPSAAAIVAASRDRISAATVSTRSRMVITAKDGTTTERLVDQYAKDGPNGARTVIVFQQPASIAGTRFLTMAGAAGQPDDRWIFLPSLGKVRRVAAGEGGGSFMGTDLSYDDISAAGRDAAVDNHVLARAETLAGVDCWVIESTPKESAFQYSKTISWIGKADSIARRVELYDKKGVLLKVLELSDIADVQGRLTPRTTTMTNVQAKTSTVIKVEIIKYDDPIPEGVFTVRFLETGRPQ